MGINLADAVKMFMQSAQALEILYKSGRIDQAAYEMFKGMV